MCCAYGMIIFSEERHSDHRALGVKMCLAAAFVSGGLMSLVSGIPVAIGGTDLNPAVFYGDFVVAIAAAIAEDLGLAAPRTCLERVWRRFRGLFYMIFIDFQLFFIDFQLIFVDF